MKTIPATYRRNGWVYRLLTRSGDWAIYEQLGEKRSWFELLRVRFAEARTIAGRVIEAGEYLPGDNAWGRDGFTFQTEPEARHALAVRKSVLAAIDRAATSAEGEAAAK